MKDYLAALEKRQTKALEAALIRDLATNKTKRDPFDKLHRHLNQLADEVERTMKTSRPMG